jgi:hypothetical protein
LKTNIVSSTLKNALAYNNAGVLVVNSEVVGLAPALTQYNLSLLAHEVLEARVGEFASLKSFIELHSKKLNILILFSD